MIRLICAGDLHLGRRPSRVAADAPELTVEAVWSATVEQAIALRAHAVVLTGDVVDRANRYYEALGPLMRGVARLTRAEIPVFAVSGNHDFDTLTRAADTLDGGLRLLGRGGRWERATLHTPEGHRLDLLGWSFPREHVRASALDTLPSPLSASAEVPVVGVVHGDVDASGSLYNPLDSARLMAAPCAVWLLGHVHAPRAITDPSGALRALYPGSPQALHPAELGVHGPWLVTIDPAGGPATATQLPLATVAYRRLDVDVAHLDTIEALDRRLFEALRHDLNDARAASPHLRAAVYRVQCAGQTPLYARLPAWAALACEQLDLSTADLRVTLDRITLDASPAVALDQLARRDDPPGLVAQLLLDLDAAEDLAAHEAFGPMLQRAQAAARHAAFAPLGARPSHDRWPEPHHARALIRAQLTALLTTLLAQRDLPDGDLPP